MNTGGEGHENVPYRVGERYAPVGLEEEHAYEVQEAAHLEVVHRWELVLEIKEKKH